MFKFSYNTNGLRYINPIKAVKEVAFFGYDGIEIALNKTWMCPENMSKKNIKILRNFMYDCNVEPVAMATGAKDLLSNVDYEPSLICPDRDKRHERINLLKQSEKLAQNLGIDKIGFASGFKKEEMSDDEAWTHLVEGIRECLKKSSDVILMIEPEPGMFIETTDQAIKLIEEISDQRLALNLDIGHVVCCEDDYLAKIKKACRYAKHLHIEDIAGGVHKHLIPGKGDIDFEGVFRVLIEEDYQGFVSVELYDHASVYVTALRESIQYFDILLLNKFNLTRRRSSLRYEKAGNFGTA